MEQKKIRFTISFALLAVVPCFLSLDEDCNPGWRGCGRPFRRFSVLLKMGTGILDQTAGLVAQLVGGVFYTC